LTADQKEIKGNGREIAYITCEIIDEQGKLVPYADHLIEISILGEGELIGAANGDPCAVNNYGSNKLKVYKGKAIAVVRGHKKGEVKIKVDALGLEAGECKISLV
jgi:beta-galactosidase